MKQTLNGLWEHRIGKGAWGVKEVPFSAICVGHSECRRDFDLDFSADVILLTFDGITYNANVYLNGTYLGKMLPYCEYSFDITAIAKKSDNSLLVEIEDIDAPFGPSEGWENFGGIIRDVSLIYKNKAYIKDVKFTSLLTNNYTDAEYSVQVFSSVSAQQRITLSYDGIAVDTYTGERTRTLCDVKLWSPNTPELYTLTVELLENGTVCDTYQTRVGFCQFECGKNRFLLNGKDIFLKGVCRHEMYGESSGHTVPYELIYKDMKMIKEAGCNFVRLVHYPHNKVTLDIADELGLLCCEEPGMWQADVTDPRLTKDCLEVLKRTVIRDRNHPSIAFWLAFNECAFDETFLKEAVSICRQYDPRRLVSGANNMSNEETKRYYTLCGLDFYTMHPYSETFEMARRASEELNDKPLMFTEWGGYYVYDNPHLLSDFLLSMHQLYLQNALAGTCLWYWAEIKDYNRGGAACCDGTLKEALVDFDRKPNLIYHAFTEALKKMENTDTPADKYEASLYFPFDKKPLFCAKEPSYSSILSLGRQGMKTRLARTRKKQMEIGPILQKEEISGICLVPHLLGTEPLVFECDTQAEEFSILGMVSLNHGYPISGGYGEEACEILITYSDGEVERYVAKNGVDITVAYTSVGSSRINPIAENAKRLLSFSYDKNFEEYIINCLDIKTKGKKIESVKIRALNDDYKILIYGVFA